ncbi:Holliday junction branch migration protein RuvA [Olivibacter sitiensis]|uniref:Holliday junction branch migration protein RuvA n=1 Tax=Olivibacter sitiensis TaxID=376470 RepID=UPI00047FEAAE|nr:Holliday junction branch migration protein RuvA [Olivibacter sitiensis]
MYDYLSGKLIEKHPTHVVLDVGGVGYHLHISLYTFEQIKDLVSAKLYTSLQIKEDSHTLYGFVDKGERKLFHHLISVSGIGASTGRMILSSINPNEIQTAIVQGDVKQIQRIKGIGPKSAQRLILELQDKLKKEGDGALMEIAIPSSTKEEALSALLVLGYNKLQSEKILDRIVSSQPEATTVEALIKLALKNL